MAYLMKEKQYTVEEAFQVSKISFILSLNLIFNLIFRFNEIIHQC